MENTLENKLKFYAMFLGQKVLRHTKNTSSLELKEVTFASLAFSGVCGSILELNSVSSITDEGNLSECNFQSLDEYGFNVYRGGSLSFTSSDIDYLRSKGYALPWMGLSVETLIEYGWLKLKTT